MHFTSAPCEWTDSYYNLKCTRLVEAFAKDFQEVLHDPYRCTSLQDLWASGHLVQLHKQVLTNFMAKNDRSQDAKANGIVIAMLINLSRLQSPHQFWLSSFITAVISRVTVVPGLASLARSSQCFLIISDAIVVLWAVNYSLCTHRHNKTRTWSRTRIWKTRH